MAEAAKDAGLVSEDKVTLAVLGSMMENLEGLIERYHVEDCTWRDKMESRLSTLEQWKATSMQRWEENARAHQVTYTILTILVGAAVILAVYLSAHLGTPVVIK